MADRLAGLVLPDSTPVEELPEEPVDTEKIQPSAPKIKDRSDWIIALAGIGLAVLCGSFPWYIFVHQEEFGIRPLTFSGAGKDAQEPLHLTDELTPEDWAAVNILDFRSTGTVGNTSPTGEALHQPFPGDGVSFQMLDAMNGHAIIEDRYGFWVVRSGDELPDGSLVDGILQREDGSWVLTTSDNREFRPVR